MDGSSSENISEIPSGVPPNLHLSEQQKIRKIGSQEKNKSLTSPPSLNSIPLDKQKHTDSPASLHSELSIGNYNSDARSGDSHVSFGSNADANERMQRLKECIRSTVNDPLTHKSNIEPMESNRKSIPFTSAFNRESGSHVRGAINNLGNKKSPASNPCSNIKGNTALRNDQLPSDLRLLPETFSELGSPNGTEKPVFNCSKTLAGLYKLFEESRVCQRNQKAFQFISVESSNKRLKKDSSLCKTPLCNPDKSAEQFEELKSPSEQVLHTTKTECKFTSFNFSLRVQNQGQQKDEDSNLNQKQASRRFSTSCKAGAVSKVDKSCFFVQTTWAGRKCKSNVHIQHETKIMHETKFLADYSSKSAPLDSNSSYLPKSTTRLKSSKSKGIPTYLGRILPAKVSVLLLNGPVRMNYTENISGKSQEILMCTNDIIEDVIRRDKNIQHQDIVKTLIARSRPYIGKPVHIIFEPIKATKIPSPVDSGAGNPVPLHPSPAKHNLLPVKPDVSPTIEYKANDEPNSNRTLCPYCGNSSDKTLVEKQKAKSNLLTKKSKPVYKIGNHPNDETIADKVLCSSSKKTLVEKQKAKPYLLVKNSEVKRTIDYQLNAKKAAGSTFCSSSNETLVDRQKAKPNSLPKKPNVASAIYNQGNDETDGDRTLCSNWENSSSETLVGKPNGQSKEIENRMPCSANRLETSELRAKKKLKIRLCHRRKSRTALKRVNVKQIVNSVFGNFFHFYSVIGGHLKSGSVITKSNSILWLREAGVATDPESLEMANQLFKDTAGAKVVLNIFDYMKFLAIFARRLRMATVDLVGQLTTCELPKASKIQLSESRRLKTLPQSKRPDPARTGIASARRSQSLPNLKTPHSVFNS